jgi:hypothetical protein
MPEVVVNVDRQDQIRFLAPLLLLAVVAVQ